jgi:hypothetical protein
MKSIPFLVFLVLLFLLVPGGLSITNVVTPHISSVTPETGPNTGLVTLTITGDGFVTGTTWVELRRCGGAVDIMRGSITGLTPTEITASFNMYGKDPGAKYNLWVKNAEDQVALRTAAFIVYGASSTGTTTTATTTATTTTSAESTGDNSVFFQTIPSGATIYLDGDEIGTSTFTYHTTKDGVHDVLVKMIGYEDYSDRVTIIDNNRVLFSAVLTPLSASGTTTTTTPHTSSASGTTTHTATTFPKSTVKIPTPLGTDPPVTAEESPVDPALALWAAGIGIAFVVIRRR